MECWKVPEYTRRMDRKELSSQSSSCRSWVAKDRTLALLGTFKGCKIVHQGFGRKDRSPWFLSRHILLCALG
jgi:hypothetical protein